MVTTLPHPDAGRHRTDAPHGARAPHRSGRGRHVAAPDHARRRRIIGLGAVTVATVAVLPVVTSTQLADVTSEAWERLSGPPSASSDEASGGTPVDRTAGSVEPSPGAGAHRGEDPASAPAAAPEPSAETPSETPSAEPSTPEPPPPSGEPEPAPSPEAALTATYRVLWGDTLTSIAADHGMTWREVHEANAAAIGPNPNLVVVGTVLRVLPA